MNSLIKKLQDVGDILDKLSAFVAAVTFLAMTIIVIMQVISRCFLSYSFQWAEEMARYLFIWSTMLASACAVRAHMHIGVDIVVNFAKGNLKRAITFAAQAFIIAAVIILVIYGAQQTAEAFASGQTATSFPVSAGVLYLSIPVSGVLMFLYAVTQLLELIFTGEFRQTRLPFAKEA